jgi:hypothetical protein
VWFSQAGDSEKKRAAKEAFARSLWVNAIKIINVRLCSHFLVLTFVLVHSVDFGREFQFLYISIRIFWKWESFTLSVMFGFAVITGLTYTCWNFISGALKTGSPYDYWEDLLCINRTCFDIEPVLSSWYFTPLNSARNLQLWCNVRQFTLVRSTGCT